MKRGQRRPTMQSLRRQMRHNLHGILDSYLRSTTKAPDGSPVTVLDDVVMRCQLGYAVRLDLHIVKPRALQEAEDQAKREAEAPPLVDTAQRVMADLAADKPKITVMP